ncbi:MAG: SRPBCC family protein, partial [Methanomicrobiales archaeon]|nr:SRPBCC family protein [Methanomicrobiales archaeon]
MRMVGFDTSVDIHRPVGQVFTYVANGEHGSAWNSAVQEVAPLTTVPAQKGSRYRMIRDLPIGRVENVYEIIEFVPDQVLTIQIVSGPNPFIYRYHFSEKGGVTTIALHGEVAPEGLHEVLGARGRLIPEAMLARLVK